MLGAEGFHVADSAGVAADRNGDVTEHFGDHYGRDAEGAHGFAGVVKGADDFCHVFTNGAILTLKGVGEEVFGGTVAAGEYHCVEIRDIALFDGFHVATGDTRSLQQHIPLLLHRLTGNVVHHMILPIIGCKNLIFTAITVNSQQSHDRFVDFAAVQCAAAAQYHCKFFHNERIFVLKVQR